MIFTETKLAGAFILDPERRADNRGHFARTFCQREMEEHGLKPVIAQANAAYNKYKGTLRGMHFQFPPKAETKLVRATRGGIVDIIVDLRPESPTFLEHVAVELTEENGRSLYVPERFAHGYQSLTDDTVASYELGAFHTPAAEGGLLHDDPRLGLEWPLAVAMISPRDRSFQPLSQVEDELRRRMAPVTREQRAAHRREMLVSV
jgi:dTDP-4-dehydrorhamnose 3,5-epimerase